MIKIPSLPGGTLRKIKVILYAIQALLVSIAWILALAVLTKSGDTGPATKFYFALIKTWLCIPALLYLQVVPLWARTQRFANPYAAAALDVLYTILWLAAFCAVQIWTDSGVTTASGCANFTFGSQSKCQISYATVIIGVIVFILWLLAASISIYFLIHLRRNGTIPDTKPEISKPVFDETRSTWSLRPNAQGHMVAHPQTRLNRGRQDEEEGSVHTQTEEGTHLGRAISYGQDQPRTAPPTSTQFALPQWRSIRYGERPPNQPPPIREKSPSRYKGPTLPQNPSPPRLQIISPRPEPRSPRNPFVRDGSSSATATGRAPFDTLRGMPRVPVPGPASRHAGGYTSAHHTPLPPGMIPKNTSWPDDQRARSPEDRGRLVFPEADYSRIAATRAW
ncbi:hypothetical protein MMC13_008410 [Lambiella insularis]|nr:hypothetical protein [Lambiella insularis]